jgi:tetrahydromethanopterin S-methyltransferase subunit F
MERSLTITPNTYPGVPSINVHGDAVDGFAIGVLVTILVVIFLMSKMR